MFAININSNDFCRTSGRVWKLFSRFRFLHGLVQLKTLLPMPAVNSLSQLQRFMLWQAPVEKLKLEPFGILHADVSWHVFIDNNCQNERGRSLLLLLDRIFVTFNFSCFQESERKQKLSQTNNCRFLKKQRMLAFVKVSAEESKGKAVSNENFILS